MLGIFGIILWIILSTIAMFFYPGGTEINPSTLGYSFWSNYISDLGRTVTYSGAPNSISQILFTVFTVIYGFTTFVFFIALLSIFTESRSGKWISIIGGIFAGISAIGAFCLAFAPSDVYPELHGLFSGVTYLAAIFLVIFIVIEIFLTKKLPQKYAFLLLISVILTFIAMIVLFTGPKVIVAPEWLEIYVVGQKVLTYVSLAAFGATAYGAWKLSGKSAT